MCGNYTQTWGVWEFAIKNDYTVLQYLPNKYKTLKLCQVAVQTSIQALKYVPKEYIEQLNNMNTPIVELNNEKINKL